MVSQGRLLDSALLKHTSKDEDTQSQQFSSFWPRSPLKVTVMSVFLSGARNGVQGLERARRLLYVTWLLRPRNALQLSLLFY